jgi:hypothetical protein
LLLVVLPARLGCVNVNPSDGRIPECWSGRGARIRDGTPRVGRSGALRHFRAPAWWVAARRLPGNGIGSAVCDRLCLDEPAFAEAVEHGVHGSP